MICSKIQIDSLSNTVVLFIDCESAVRAITRLPPCTAPPVVPPELDPLEPEPHAARTVRAPTAIRARAAVDRYVTVTPLGIVGAGQALIQDKPLFLAKIPANEPDVNSGGTLERNLNDVVTSSAVRYVVLGCGAVGGTVAAGLARDGHEVLACDADPAVVSAIAARGLRIEGPVENFTVAVPAVTPGDLPARIGGPVLIAVKAHHTAAAAALLAGRLHGGAFAVGLQNGLTGA